VTIADRAGTQPITFLDTRDLARTSDFYERILGLRLARDQGTCRKEPADNPPYRIYNAFVRDPNGYLLEIQRFWEPLG
jgi:catechol 2,3-dioxygenase-like lactoylglutathione lyase family enzyme